jgi:hypothetical protein
MRHSSEQQRDDLAALASQRLVFSTIGLRLAGPGVVNQMSSFTGGLAAMLGHADSPDFVDEHNRER